MFWTWIALVYTLGCISGVSAVWFGWSVALMEADQIDTEVEKQ